MLELLKAGVGFAKIAVVNNLDKDELTTQILSEAASRNIAIESLPIWKMSQSRSGEAKEVIIGYIAPQKTWPLEKLITELKGKNQVPFFLFLNKVHLANNIGAITRTAFAAGVNGLIFDGAKDAFFNEDTVHFSLGAIARIPHVKMNIHDALKELTKNNITSYALDMGGTNYFKEDLTGPSAFVLGAEREGLQPAIANRCDKKIAIPMNEGINSLGVTASASVMVYEKLRQDSL